MLILSNVIIIEIYESIFYSKRLYINKKYVKIIDDIFVEVFNKKDFVFEHQQSNISLVFFQFVLMILFSKHGSYNQYLSRMILN